MARKRKKAVCAGCNELSSKWSMSKHRLCQKCQDAPFVKKKRPCRRCGKPFRPKGKTNVYCNPVCYYNDHVGSRFDIMERDNFTCIYCGSTNGERKLAVDHIYPKSKGGPGTAGNLVTACALCNSQKGSKILSDSSIEQILKEVRRRNEIKGWPNDMVMGKWAEPA